MFSRMHLLLCFFALFICATLVSTQNIYKTIALNKTQVIGNKELYGDFIYLNSSSTLQVKFTDVGKKLSFIIFQAHSHLYDNKIYNETGLKTGKYVQGTNNGLYTSVKEGLDTFYVENPHKDVDLKIFITVHGYTDFDPIPGGCNMEFSEEISPFMRAITYNKTYIIVQAAAPRNKINSKCIQNDRRIGLKFRILYLPQHDYEPDVYFDAIQKISTFNSNIEYARSIPEVNNGFWKMRRMLSAYPGTGAVYVVVAFIDKENYSIYVPTHSYACSPLETYDCELLEDTLSMFLSATMFFLGIFMCYHGHRFFKTQILTVGCLSGFVVTYILLSIMFKIEGPALLTASALSGLCVGAIRVVCWWLYGIPVLVVVLSSADVGFLVASIVYYVYLGNDNVFLSYLQVDFNFWCVFILIMLLITIFLLSISHFANIVSCAVVGSYTAIYPIDYYLGSNMKYIINNTIRRATVTDFNKALIIPPFQWRDHFLTFTWAALATTGFMYQFYYSRGRPPFPPPPRSVRAVPEELAEPILVPSGSIRTPNVQRNSSSYFTERTPLLS